MFSNVPQLPKHIERYGKLEPFDDGHIPETFALHDTNEQQQTMHKKHKKRQLNSSSRIIYYDYDKILHRGSGSDSGSGSGSDSINTNNNASSPPASTLSSSSSSLSLSLNDPMLHVWNNALPESLTRKIYQKTTTGAATGTGTTKPSVSASSTSSVVATNTAATSVPAAWGTYVTIAEALDHLKSCTCRCQFTNRSSPSLSSSSSSPSHVKTTSEKEYHDLAVAAVAHFLVDDPNGNDIDNDNNTNMDTNGTVMDKDSSTSTICTAASSPIPPSSSGFQTFIQQKNQIKSLPSSLSSSRAMPTIHEIIQNNIQKRNNDYNNTNDVIHGVGVWSLSSSTQQNVPYHIDYAEYIRYKYNIVVPPLYAGTVQCSFINTGTSKNANTDKNTNTSTSTNKTNIKNNNTATSTASVASKCDMNRNTKNPQNTMRGGNFAVNLRGWEHYNKFGYKGYKQNDDMGGWKDYCHLKGGDYDYDDGHNDDHNHCHYENNENDDGNRNDEGNEQCNKHLNNHNDMGQGSCVIGENDDEVQINHINRWVTIPYKFNRGILHTGFLPHLSTTVHEFQQSNNNDVDNNDKTDNKAFTIETQQNVQPQHQDQLQQCQGISSNTEMKRVIMGFNVFGNDIGVEVSKVPEHSNSFRRWVKWYRTVVLATTKPTTKVVTTDKKEGGISMNKKNSTSSISDKVLSHQSENSIENVSNGNITLDDLRRNKPMMKLLVLAKREKIKKEWETCRKSMTVWLVSKIFSEGERGESSEEGKDFVILKEDEECSKDDYDVLKKRIDEVGIVATMAMDDIVKHWVEESNGGRDYNFLGLNDISFRPSVDDLIVHIQQMSKMSCIHYTNKKGNEGFAIDVSSDDRLVQLRRQAFLCKKESDPLSEEHVVTF